MAAKQQKPATPETKPEAEKQTNCLGCGKPLKKVKKYYRDGKFYCNKKCWRNYINKTKKQEQEKK